MKCEQNGTTSLKFGEVRNV